MQTGKAADWISHHRPTFTVINAILALVIAATAAVATIVQAWVSASQTSPLPQLQATSISELRAQIEERRTDLQREIRQLNTLLDDLGRAETALTNAPAPPLSTAPPTTDPWWRSALKAFAVYFALAVSIAVSVPAGVVDLLGLIVGYDFPILRTIWGWSWSYVAIAWYWERATASGIAAGVLLFFGLGLIGAATESKSGQTREVPESTA